MCPYEKYSPVTEKLSPGTILATFEQRQIAFREQKLEHLKRLSPVICLPSFLIRSFQDYVSNAKKLSQYEQMVINAWERAGLDRGKATAALQRLYDVPGIDTHLDAKFLSAPVGSLDTRLVAALGQVQWSEFLQNYIDPSRLQKAFDTGKLTNLSEREKDFVDCHNSTYFPDSKELGLAGVAAKTGWLLQRTSGKYLLCEAYKPARVYDVAGFLAADATALASEGPDEPAKKVCAYNWRLDQQGHTVKSYSEATGDDPVFIVNVFKRSDFATTLKTLLDTPHVYKPEDDEKHHNFRRHFDVLYRARNDYLGTERPVVVVSAFEDDQYFSDDTKNYVKFGLDVASRLAQLDPTGIASITVAVLAIVWGIVCLIDWLDDNDYIGTTTYEFDPSVIPDGTDRSHPFSQVVDVRLRKGDSDWFYRIQFTSCGVVYVTT